MLMKPPSILDELVSQDSEAYTNKSKERGSKNRGVKKQSTIKIGANSNYMVEKHRQIDNQSVNSNGSRKSKDKKTKETTLSRPNILGETSQYKNEDANSVHSNGSKHSHKSAKKETTIMQRPKMDSSSIKGKFEDELKKQVEAEHKFISFKEAIQQPSESIIHILDIKDKQTRPRNQGEPQRNEKIVNQVQNKHKFAPFAEMDHNNSSDEQIPVHKLEQPHQNPFKIPYVVGGKKQEYKSESTPIKPVTAIEESKSIFDESCMNETKSRRKRDIFGKTKQIDNGSKISNTIEQSISGLEDNSRRKSKSRLRQIFNNSRQNKQIEESVMPNQSKMSNFNQIQQSPSVYFKPATGNNDRMIQLQRKVIDDDDDRFGQESSKSGLDLSQSQFSGKNMPNNQRDSLFFQFQPEKKKGMSVASKGIKSGDPSKVPQNNMINLKDNLTSKTVQVKKEGIMTSKPQEMVKLNNKTLVSKQLQGAQKILKGNQQFLIKSGIMDLSSSYKPKPSNNSIGSDYLFKLQEEDPIQPYHPKQIVKNERPWHETVPKNQEQFLTIKKVERSEKIINNKEKEQKEEAIRKQREEREIAERRQIELQQMQKAKETRQRLRRQNERILQENKQRAKLQQQLQKQKEQKRRMAELQIQRETQNERQLKLKKRQIEKKRQQEQAIKLEQQQAERLKKQTQERQEKKRRQNQNALTYPKQMSENSSEKSKSSKKGKGKKESSISRDRTHKVQVRNQSPRAQESFYQSNASAHQRQEQSKEQASEMQDKFDPIQKKKPKLLNFQDDDIDVKPKSKTDINFYDFTHSQNSIKAPSSRPPLSKKSNSSVSKSKQKKPKQSTLANNITKKVEKSGYLKPSEKPSQKLTLMERALMKHNEQSEGSCSQESFRSSEDVGSKNSRESMSSKNSKKSLKKESTIGINIKLNTMMNLGKPPLSKKNSFTSQHEEELLQLQRQREKIVEENKVKEQLLRQRPIVSKNCTFIDERGRLVQKDLIIKGAEVYGVPGLQDSNIDIRERMRRSRQGRRSRSKSRERKNYANQSSENEGYYNSSSSSFYENSTSNKRYPNSSQYNAVGNGNSGNNLILKQFLKPVEQVPNYSRGRGEKPASKKRIQEAQQGILNEFFGNKVQQSAVSSNTNQSRSRKSIHRTERSNSKR